MNGIKRNTEFTSPATGITYVIDSDGKAKIHDDWDDQEPYQLCECELDYNCPLHQGRPSAIERINDEWASRETDIDAMRGM